MREEERSLLATSLFSLFLNVYKGHLAEVYQENGNVWKRYKVSSTQL